MVDKLAVASGKGGTGKTLISTSLALLMEDITFLDCDVEEPNSHIFLNPKVEEIRKAYKVVPDFDLKKCDFCKKCQEVCQFGALAVLKDRIITFYELCHGCCACVDLCPRGAVKESKKEVGEIVLGSFDGGRFVGGRLNIGEPMATPVIRQVKELMKGKTIIDAPPGSSCPVIESIKGTDFVLLVTEPTPFGIHDVSILMEVLKELSIPGGVVINRKMGEDEIYKRLRGLCDEEGFEVLCEIPFSREVAELYARGKNLVHSSFRGVLEKLAERVMG